MECPACGERAPAGANWCEACGSDLAAEPSKPCVACGERDISDDGYCMSCGHKQPEERDHLELEDGDVVAISDRGLRHRHNEDAVAIGTLASAGSVLVVCDGVSSTPGSAEASMAAANAARDVLVDRLRDAGPAADSSSVEAALLAATTAAQAEASASPEVASSAPHSDGGPPSSTFVAAVGRRLDGGSIELSVAWLGDSRAYWLGGDGAVELTADHEIDGSLTRWLGADSGDPQPDMKHHSSPDPGRLLLCSDGLWRYAEPAVELGGLVRRLEIEHTAPKALASALVDHALEGGGHDNITIALWTTGATSRPTGDLVADGAVGDGPVLERLSSGLEPAIAERPVPDPSADKPMTREESESVDE